MRKISFYDKRRFGAKPNLFLSGKPTQIKRIVNCEASCSASQFALQLAHDTDCSRGYGMVLRAEFKNSLLLVNYQAITQKMGLVSTPLEAYLYLRAMIILGRYEETETAFQDISQKVTLPPFLSRFLTLQLQIYRRLNLAQSCEELWTLLPLIPDDNYLRGEFYLRLPI